MSADCANQLYPILGPSICNDQIQVSAVGICLISIESQDKRRNITGKREKEENISEYMEQ